MIKECESVLKGPALCRKYGISDATFYKYKAKFGGMNLSDAKKPRALEDESNSQKRMLADAMLDNATLKLSPQKMYGPPRGCKLFDDIFGLRKCIRPLISG